MLGDLNMGMGFTKLYCYRQYYCGITLHEVSLWRAVESAYRPVPLIKIALLNLNHLRPICWLCLGFLPFRTESKCVIRYLHLTPLTR